MMLIVTPQSQVDELLIARKPTHVLSLISPDADAPLCDAPSTCDHLILRFNDISEPISGLTAPSEWTIKDIIEFGNEWDRAQPLLIHCFAGISRSTAAAYILACSFSRSGEEEAIARQLRLASPTATPNPRMISLADTILARSGRMIDAIQSIGRGTDAPIGFPFELHLN